MCMGIEYCIAAMQHQTVIAVPLGVLEEARYQHDTSPCQRYVRDVTFVEPTGW